MRLVWTLAAGVLIFSLTMCGHPKDVLGSFEWDFRSCVYQQTRKQMTKIMTIKIGKSIRIIVFTSLRCCLDSESRSFQHSGPLEEALGVYLGCYFLPTVWEVHLGKLVRSNADGLAFLLWAGSHHHNCTCVTSCLMIYLVLLILWIKKSFPFPIQ